MYYYEFSGAKTTYSKYKNLTMKVQKYIQSESDHMHLDTDTLLLIASWDQT